MPVDDLHRCYTERLPQWMRCRDACEGEDVVKSKGTTYLPRLSNQKDLEYDAYKRRAAWYGATARTVLGLAGSVMRKSPAVLAPEVLATHLDDVTETSVSLTTFASILVQEVLTVGRVGILLDMPEGTPEGMPRPQWVEYRTEQIRNWKTEMLGGVRTLTMVVLSEEYEEPAADGFRSECRTQYRVLRLVEGRYVVEIWRSDQKRRSEYVLVKSIMPVVRGVSLPYLPFVFVNALHIDADPSKPPLLDLVDLNFKHYLNSADLEHGRHFTALPTPYVTGMAKDKQGSLQIGSSTAWCIPQADAKVGMLEFSGAGLGALERALDMKERQMAVLGARMLEAQKLQTEAPETHAIRRSGEASLLASIAETISIALTKVARWHAAWAGARDTETAKISLNKDFFGVPLSPAELAELVKSWQSGAISYETLYYNLEQGEITRPGVEADEERSQIENEAPMMDLGAAGETAATPSTDGQGAGTRQTAAGASA